MVSDVFTGQFMQEKRINLGETANTVCLLKLILND